ncbi:hypothetical protein VSDG_03483 [Cytospora chrysosperma]|uniref:Uncharacterized protein n=1 Tax=Cytospora chrysosperma TaxID=252740 RepID=A0A423W9Y0_CYTCH|nr:hypothetical protein VSDG_03483 [Valsa sordida]
MGFGLVAGLASAGLASLATAEDLLFHSTMVDTQEYTRATSVLGYTVHVATPEEWNSYTTADFERYKSVIIPDPTCGTVSEIDFFDATKAAWGPAIMGNIILIGTDPSFHASSRPGALTLIDDAVQFSASGNGTGLYFALSCYYDSVAASTVEALSYFGTITVRGQLACYNDAHLVANSSALGKLDDGALSDWSCSVHEVFTSYPTTGLFGFEPLAIAEGATGDGQKDFADRSNGIPYIIVKGATPAGCGDGVWDPTLEEECDDGPLNGTPDSSCSSSCKCLNGSIAPGFGNSFVHFFHDFLHSNGVDELYAGSDQLKYRLLISNFNGRPIHQLEVQPCPPNLERVDPFGAHHLERCDRLVPLDISVERKWLISHSLESIGILHQGLFQRCAYHCNTATNELNTASARIIVCIIAWRIPCSPDLDNTVSASPSHSLLCGSREQHTRGKWYFLLRKAGIIVRVVHTFKHNPEHVSHIAAELPDRLDPYRILVSGTEFVSVHRGYDCGVNDLVRCGCHEFCSSVDFVCHCSICELELCTNSAFVLGPRSSTFVSTAVTITLNATIPVSSPLSSIQQSSTVPLSSSPASISELSSSTIGTSERSSTASSVPYTVISSIVTGPASSAVPSSEVLPPPSASPSAVDWWILISIRGFFWIPQQHKKRGFVPVPHDLDDDNTQLCHDDCD